jgi:hypothetical protein
MVRDYIFQCYAILMLRYAAKRKKHDYALCCIAQNHDYVLCANSKGGVY